MCCKPKPAKYYSYSDDDEYSSDEEQYSGDEEQYSGGEEQYSGGEEANGDDSYSSNNEEEEEEYYPPAPAPRSSSKRHKPSKPYDDGAPDAEKPYERRYYGSSGGKYKKAYRDASDNEDEYSMTLAKKRKEPYTPETLSAPVKSGHKKAVKASKANFPWLGPLMN